MPRHATKTSFHKGQKFLLNGKPMGRTKNCVSWNKNKKLNPLKKETIVKIKLALTGRENIWLRKNKTSLVCLFCQKEFLVMPYKAKERKYCSLSCTSKSRPREIIMMTAQKARASNIKNGTYKKHSIRMLNGGAIKARLGNIQKPTRPEILLGEMLQTLFPNNWKYVGDSKFWIENINPDFVNTNGQKIIVEMFGDYWHNKTDVMQKDKDKELILTNYGWKRIIVWEHELNDINILRRRLLSLLADTKIGQIA